MRAALSLRPPGGQLRPPRFLLFSVWLTGFLLIKGKGQLNQNEPIDEASAGEAG
jgi:hypothetical protein